MKTTRYFHSEDQATAFIEGMQVFCPGVPADWKQVGEDGAESSWEVTFIGERGELEEGFRGGRR